MRDKVFHKSLVVLGTIVCVCLESEGKKEMFSKRLASTLSSVTSSIKGGGGPPAKLEASSGIKWRETLNFRVGFWCHPGTSPYENCYCALEQGINTSNCSAHVPAEPAELEWNSIQLLKPQRLLSAWNGSDRQMKDLDFNTQKPCEVHMTDSLSTNQAGVWLYQWVPERAGR